MYIDGLETRTTVGLEKRPWATERKMSLDPNKSGVNTTKRESAKQPATQKVLVTKQERRK